MGSGKTTIGKIVANHLNIKFLDLDAYIELAENKKVGAIFKDKGELYFRKKEHEYLSEIFFKESKFVLSVGGGTPCFGNNMKLINENTVNSFYINVGIPELVERLMPEKKHRPLISHLQDSELPEFIGKHLFERSYFYNQSHHTIKSNKKSPTELAEAIVNQLV
jgi:shikimate kinase